MAGNQRDCILNLETYQKQKDSHTDNKNLESLWKYRHHEGPKSKQVEFFESIV